MVDFEAMEKRFDDRTDATLEISLLEYGILRDSKTGYTIFAHPKAWKEDSEDYRDYIYDWTEIDIEQVKEILNDISEGFFSFVGIEKAEYLKMLDNNYLASVIQDIKSYINPWDYLNYDYTLEEVLSQ